MPPEQKRRIDAIARAAEDWQDPDYPSRAEAVEQTLDAPNRFTEQALAFAINQQMSLLDQAALAEWVEGRWTDAPKTVGVLNAGNIPLAGLQDFLAILLTGHRYEGALSSKSPVLLPAFAEEVFQHHPDLPVCFHDKAECLFKEAEAIIATGSDDTRSWARGQCERAGIPASRRLLRGHRYGVAVIDGNESDDDRENLAEEVLLHEGYGCRNVALIWAPRNLSPDLYLEAFALFRGVFPVHPEVPGTLQMQQAFLEATDQAHAYGEGLEFLVSRGTPEPQRPGHVRWTEYDTLKEACGWLREHANAIQVVVARPGLMEQLPGKLPVEPLGTAQRPPLDWHPDGTDTVAFLANL